MLLRRRQGGQRKNDAALAGQSQRATKAGVGGWRAVVEERLSAFAAYRLPSLMDDADFDDTTIAEVHNSYSAVSGESPQGSRCRLTHALLLVYLHIGSDPPDVSRVEPCARLECWINPLVTHVTQYAGRHGGGSDSIASALSRQYASVLGESLEQRRIVEANVDASRKALAKMRRMAQDGRVLVHYNGHGMPRATELGEVWMFDEKRTHYVPLNTVEMAELVGSPALYVLDCNSAGSVLKRWYKDHYDEQRPDDMFLCACSAGEVLPQSPLLPADMLTSCLTTPLHAALEWYIGYSHHTVLLPQVTEEMIRNLPGDLTNRKSPRGELNWVLMGVLETIAWCTLPPARFQLLFQHDPGVKILFCNFLLADRLMREAGCTPVSHPPIPEEAHLHPMWELWDYVLENAISQLPQLLVSGTNTTYQSSTFFDDQLTAFEVWVESGDVAQLPEQLPCVLLALIQLMYRVRAFTLLVKYLDSGKVAGQRAIMCGIFPYLSKLIACAPEVFLIVTILWMQTIRSDPSEACREVQRHKCEGHFIDLLKLDDTNTKIQQVEYGQRVTSYSLAPHSSRRSPIPPEEKKVLSTVSSTGNFTTCVSHKCMHNNGEAGGTELLDLHNTRGVSNVQFSEEMPHQPLQPTQPVATLHRSPEAGMHIHSRGASSPLGPTTGSARDASRKRETVYYLVKDIDLSRCKSMACYILCQYLARGVTQCLQCWNKQLLNFAFKLLSSSNAELRSWACLTLSQLFLGLRHAKNFASRECTLRLDLFTRLLQDRSPVVRSSCVTLLASIVGPRVDMLPPEQQMRRLQMEKSLLIKLRDYLFDASMNVREELIFFACQILYAYHNASACRLEGIQDYVQKVGQQSTRWALQEADVHIKSQLHAGRPTLNLIFDDVVIFETSELSADDPPPPSPWLDARALEPPAVELAQGLLHDAARMLYILDENCDGVTVRKALCSLVTGAEPQSQRLSSESRRTMSRVASTNSVYHLSEADRARATWNADMMRQLVLDLHEGKMDPRSSVQLPDSHSVHAGDGGTSGAVVSSSARHYQVLPSPLPSDTIVSTTFRSLEPSMVVATKDQKIHYVSYENYTSQTMVRGFSVRLSGPVHDVHIVNDLSEQCGLLLVNKRGGFTLLRGWAAKDSLPVEAALFSACPPPPPNTWFDIQSVYRSNSATLFYGGSIGSSGGTEIHALSLTEEQVTQTLQVSGDPALTCLVCHTTQRALLAGCSDGVVRYYDDRQRQGQMGAVGMLHCRVAAANAAATSPSIISVGLMESGTGFSIAAATSGAVYLFDSRRLHEPVTVFSRRDLYGANALPGKAGAPLLRSCSVGVHTGLVGVSFQDNTFAAYNAKGLILNDHPISVGSYATSPSTLPSRTEVTSSVVAMHPPVMPATCVAHSLRPMMSFGGELLFVHL